ncbi:MAG: hypothetical protein ACSHYB_13740 [Roseibacillus sp.]
MKTTLHLTLACTFSFLTWSCNSTSHSPESPKTPEVTPSEVADKKWRAHQTELRESLNETKSLSAIKVPILKSTYLEKRWGKPSISTSSDGLYRLYYDDPESSFDNFTIIGSSEPLVTFGDTPPPISGMGTSIPQEWKTTTIMNQNVNYFVETSGGNNGEMWATEAFTRTSPDGRVGYYRLQTEFNDLDAPDRFSEVSW